MLPGGNLMKGKVLVVDDEEHVIFAFKTFLEEKGYEVLSAHSYDSALAVLSDSEIDVVVSDIIMGAKTGTDLLREVKDRNLRCPVIMITGAPSIDTAAKSLRLGAFDYIAKPIKKDAILRVITQAFRFRQLDDEKERYRRNLEAIIRSVQDGIVAVDHDLRITGVNEAIVDFFDVAPGDITNKKISDITDKTQHACKEILQSTLETRETVKEYRAHWRGAHGRHQSVVMNCSPLIGPEGRFLGAVLVIRDVSRISDLERQLGERLSFFRLIGKSTKMQEIYCLLETLSDTSTTVLLTGESGTGKELVAEAIHYNGVRAEKPLVKVNCSALAENLLESELFGHVAGAFTGALKDKTGRFQMADGGTILLDEIGDISPSLQLKLLRVLQEQEFERVGDTRPITVDVRIIAATNCNLKEKISRGLFRQDLYYRLKVMEISLPPLRERLDDIPLLVEHFCATLNKKLQKNIEGVSGDVLRIFMGYDWPGNIRELGHAVEHAFILCNDTTIAAEHLPPEILSQEVFPAAETTDDGTSPGAEALIDALEKTRWNKAKAARILGISRQTMYRKIKQFNIE